MKKNQEKENEKKIIGCSNKHTYEPYKTEKTICRTHKQTLILYVSIVNNFRVLIVMNMICASYKRVCDSAHTSNFQTVNNAIRKNKRILDKILEKIVEKILHSVITFFFENSIASYVRLFLQCPAHSQIWHNTRN